MDGNTLDVVVEAELKSEHRLAGKWMIRGEDGGEAASGDWSAERDPGPDLAGAWEIRAETTGGEYLARIDLENKGDSWSGQITDEEGKVTEFESVEILGTDLTIVFPWNTPDVSGVVTINGAVADDDQLSGNWKLTDGGDEEIASGPWKASRGSGKTGAEPRN